MTETKSGNVILRGVSVPNQVAPGETFEATVTVSNGAGYINPLDEDKCSLVPPGYKIEIVCDGPDGSRSTDDCITTTEVGTRDETYTFVFTAPDANSTTVEAHVEMRGSGMETGEETATVVVSDSAPEESDSGSDSSSNPFWGGSESGSGDDSGGGGLLSVVPDIGIQTIGLGLAGLLLIVAVVS